MLNTCHQVIFKLLYAYSIFKKPQWKLIIYHNTESLKLVGVLQGFREVHNKGEAELLYLATKSHHFQLSTITTQVTKTISCLFIKTEGMI